MLLFHRTLSSYFGEVVKAGFTLETLIESIPQKNKLGQYPQFIYDFSVCHFLVFKVRKPV